MGVKLLTKYVKEHHNILFKDEIQLHSRKLLFDGDSLKFCLAEQVPMRFGGAYDKLYNHFISFFKKLSHLNITAYVVLDGGVNPIKTETICARAKQTLDAVNKSQYTFPFPLLTSELFIEVLNDMGIKFVVAKFEADLLVAALANKIECPVVTNDSDFFITNVHYGVLTMDSVLEMNDQVDCFRSCYLSEYLKLDIGMLPLIAVIMGNDYSSNNFLKSIQKTSGARDINGKMLSLHPRMTRIVEYLQSFATIEDVIEHLCSTSDLLDKMELRKEIENILLEFDVDYVKEECDQMYGILTKENLVSIDSLYSSQHQINSIVEILCREGLINASIIDILYSKSHFLGIQSENFAKKCSSESSMDLRQYIYMITFASDEVFQLDEYKRVGGQYKKVIIECNPSELELIPHEVIQGQYSQDMKRTYLLKVTGFSMETSTKFDDSMLVFLVSVRYWIQQSALHGDTIKIEHLQALLIGYMQLSVNNARIQRSRNKSIDIATAHQFCRWKSILFYLIMLNDLLLRPIAPPILKNVYNGYLMHHLYGRLVEGESPDKILDESQLINFNKYIDALTDGLSNQISYKLLSKNKTKQRKIENKKHQNTGNRFASLMDSEDDEENE